MKVAYCINIWNHRQRPVCRGLVMLLGNDFRALVFQLLDCDWSRERLSMGWNLVPPNEPWIVGLPKTESKVSSYFFQGWIESADVLIYGENRYFDHAALMRRLERGKLSFKVEVVDFRPFLPQSEALAFMASLDVFVFPSGRKEGRGAILPEAMDKCCAVIANEAAGATLELVRDGENGFTFKDGDAKTLAKRLQDLVQDVSLRRQVGLAAWRTMQDWSPQSGARRLVELASRLLTKDGISHEHQGICERVG